MESTSLTQKVARLAWRAAPVRAYSALLGWGATRPIPRWLRPRVLGTFARKIGADVSEAEKSLNEYETIQAFFTRRLKSGVRPMDPDPRALLHPADGRMLVRGQIAADTRVKVKGVSFSIPELLGGADIAAPFAGGSFAITYLSPRDYHRVHTPAAGRVTAWVHIPGTLFPVNPPSVAREPELFAINERLVTLLEGEAGRFAVIMVAAFGVGHITVSYDPEVGTHQGPDISAVRFKRFPEGAEPHLDRGAELGIFHLGSTTIILFEKAKVRLDPADGEMLVRVGTRIGCLA